MQHPANLSRNCSSPSLCTLTLGFLVGALVFASATVLSGCGSTAGRNDAGIQNVANRAQFDLDCPRARLGLAPLQYDGDLVTSYAVVGCGKRAVYVRGARNTFTIDPGPIQGQPPPTAQPSR